MNLLNIQNLTVENEGKLILRKINLKINKGETVALFGPNASGKSTLAQTILGNPRYKIIEGKILFEGKDITKLAPEKRVKLGLALAWQNPPTIKGVKLSQLCSRLNASFSENYGNIKEVKSLLEREVNVDFSGGEKKISELVQIINLNPKLVIFDEIDSGLDIKKITQVSKIIKEGLIKKKCSVILITHQGEILNYLKPTKAFVLVNGEIICQGKDYREILKTIKKYGYEQCKKCKSG